MLKTPVVSSLCVQCLEQCFHAEGNGLQLNVLHSDEYKVSRGRALILQIKIKYMNQIQTKGEHSVNVSLYCSLSRLSNLIWLTTPWTAGSWWRSSLRGKYGSRWEGTCKMHGSDIGSKRSGYITDTLRNGYNLVVQCLQRSLMWIIHVIKLV